MIEDLFLCVDYSENDGECSYGSIQAVKVNHGKSLLRDMDKLRKLLVKQVLKSEFADPDDQDECELDPDNVNIVWEESVGWGRYCELQGVKVITKRDYDVLCKYICFCEIKPDPEPFQFR
jgi:hypothetical protein